MARKPYRPAVHVLARNIRAVFDQASPEDQARGADWYMEARRQARILASLYTTHTTAEFDIERAAGVIAALSPQKSWQTNIQLAADAFAGRVIRHTGANADKARRILAGDDPLEVLGGHKVRAFYLNIVGDPDVVTIDRHAVDAARGRRGAYADHDTSSPYVHAAFVEAYQRVAATVLTTPAELQAIVWVTWRRLNDTWTHRQDVSA